MKMKTFCVLEQGNRVGEELTRKKREMFSTEFSDFYRLNWGGKDDPDAFISCEGLTWSEGRSLLYKEVPRGYDYYLFCDDDIVFEMNDDAPVAERIRDLLVTYRPVAATFLDPHSWAFSWAAPPDLAEIQRRRAFPIGGFDLQVHIFQREFAEAMFPVIYHGSGRTMWYAQWVCSELYPLKQHCYTEVTASNSRHELHSDFARPQFSEDQKVVWLFNRHVRPGQVGVAVKPEIIIRRNAELCRQDASMEPVAFSKKDLDRIYDPKNVEYQNRVAVVDAKYLERIRSLDIYWKISITRLRLLAGHYLGCLRGFLSRLIRS